MSDIETIELSIEEAKKIVAKRDMALKLAGNREFKKLVLEGYLKDEAARLVGISADASVKEHWGDIHSAINGISHFQQYMRTIKQMGDIAERELAEQVDTLEELRELEAEGEA